MRGEGLPKLHVLVSGGKNGGEWGRSVNGALREFQSLGKMESVLDVVNASGNEVTTIEIATLSPFDWIGFDLVFRGVHHVENRIHFSKTLKFYKFPIHRPTPFAAVFPT